MDLSTQIFTEITAVKEQVRINTEQITELTTLVKSLETQLWDISFKMEKNLLETTFEAPKTTRSRGTTAKTKTTRNKKAVVEDKSAEKNSVEDKNSVETDNETELGVIELVEEKKKGKNKRAPAKKAAPRKRQTKNEKEAAKLAADVIKLQSVVADDS